MLIIDYTTHKCHAGWGAPDKHMLSMHALIIVHNSSVECNNSVYHPS